jgi:hypothetical protein
MEEVLDHALALFGMGYFGVPLDSVEAPLGILKSRYLRTFRPRRAPETIGRLNDGVAMRHPDRLASGKPSQQVGIWPDVCFRAPELTLLRVADDAAQGNRHCLQPVTNTEDR